LSYRVLVCDDAAFMRMMIKNIIIQNGYELAGEAPNGVQAVQQYKALRPDVVTMDIVMPEKNGIEAVKDIMAFDPNAKVIMCTAMGQQSMVIEAIQAGAKDFIVKPFQPPKVMEAIKKVLGV